MTTDESVFEWIWVGEDEGYWDAFIGDHEVASIVRRDDDEWELHRVLGEYNLGARHVHDATEGEAKREAERLVRERVAEMAQALGLLPAPLAGRPLSKRERGEMLRTAQRYEHYIRAWTSPEALGIPRRPPPPRRNSADGRHTYTWHVETWRCRSYVLHLRALRLALAADDALRASGTAVSSVEVVRRERDGLAARVRRVDEILAAHGCDCDCGCDSDGHERDCERCLACRIEHEVSSLRGALRGPAWKSQEV